MIFALRVFFGLAIAGASLALAAALYPVSLYGGLAALAIGLLWLSVLRHGNPRVADLGLFLLVIGAIWAGLEGVGWGPLLVVATAGLVGWDLTHYLGHLNAAPERQEEQALVVRHLLRLAGVVAASWLLVGLSQMASLQYNYLWAIGLAGMAVLLLTRAVRNLRRR